MAEHVTPEPRNARGIAGNSGSSVKGVLIVLLALAVCFGYFYFFTDVLRSGESPSEQTDVYTGEVRMPLPERAPQPAIGPAEVAVPAIPAPPAAPSTSTARDETPRAAGGGETNQKQTVTTRAVPSANTQKQAGVDASAGAPAVKKPAQSPGTTAAKTADHKTLSAKSAGTSVKKASAATKDAKKSSVSVTSKEKSAAKPKPVVASASKSPGVTKVVETYQQTNGSVRGGYTLVVGTYVLKSSLLADKEKLEKAGLRPMISEGTKRSEPMNRILVAELASYPEAQAELARIKKISSDAFLLKVENKFQVFGGSYFSQERAVEVQKRLQNQGLAPILKKSMVPVSTFKLSVGNYPSRDASSKDAARLRQLGFNPLTTEKK